MDQLSDRFDVLTHKGDEIIVYKRIPIHSAQPEDLAIFQFQTNSLMLAFRARRPKHFHYIAAVCLFPHQAMLESELQ